MITKCIVGLCLFFLFIPAHAQNAEIEYAKAMDRLNQGKELYFLIHMKSTVDIERLNAIVSLDRINGTIAYAYAHKKQFESFLNLNLPYQVEPHPGELIDFVCSDYSTTGLRVQLSGTSSFTSWPTYEGLLNLTKQYETNYPDLCKVLDVGTSVQGRKIQCLVITSTVKNSLKPRVLLVSGHHGDELTGLMITFRLYELLTSKYMEGDSRIKRILDSVEIWSVPLLNPDGTYKAGNHTVTGAQRANANGVDLNRTYPGGPGITPGAPEQPETKALRNFLKSFDNKFTINADLHGGDEACLYSWGGKAAAHHEKTWYQNTGTFLKNASTGGFSAGVRSFTEGGGYLAPGIFTDFGCYHVNGMKSYCFELTFTKMISTSQFDYFWNMYRNTMLCLFETALAGVQGIVVDSATGQPIKDVSVFAENYDKDSSWVTTYADGAYYKHMAAGTYSLTFSHNDYNSRTITGVVSQDRQKTVLNVTLSAKAPVDTVFIDNFETNKGWQRNPNGTDKATTGMWERGDPAQTSSNGVIYQMGTTPSGSYDLVTGRLAGTNIGSYDVDGGVTSIQSPAITLPISQEITLQFKYYFAHANNSGTDDYFRISIVGGAGGTYFEERGAANTDGAGWASHTLDISTFSGQTIALLVAAADNGGASTVEAALDDVIITAAGNSGNNPPSVNAGNDRTIIFPTNYVLMNPVVSDDGRPNPPGALSLSWKLLSGPGTVSFTDSTAADTRVDFYVEGVYEFQLTAFDGEFSASDNVSIVYSEHPINQAPVVNAGADKAVTMPNALSLAGTATDDGLPDPPGALSIAWGQVSGPGTAVFSDANALSTIVTFPVSGAYVLRLAADDGQYTVYDSVAVTVNPEGPDTVFFDNFETNKGWQRNPNGTDKATIGMWERADPAQTSYNGVICQLGTTASGSYDLVTGPLAGSNVGSYDLDGGVTSIRSPQIQLPAAQTITLSFKYYMAHLNNSGTNDYLRCSVAGGTVTKVFEELGAANNDAASWATFTCSISAYSGQNIYLLIEAADTGTSSTVECALDDVRIIAQN